MAIRWKNPIPKRIRRWAAQAWRRSALYFPKPSRRIVRKAEEGRARLRAFTSIVEEEINGMVQEEAAKAMEMRRNTPDSAILKFMSINPKGEKIRMDLFTSAFRDLPANHPARINERELIEMRGRINERKKLHNAKFLNEKVEIFEELLPVIVRRTLAEIGVRDAKKGKEVVNVMKTINSWSLYSAQAGLPLPNDLMNRTTQTVIRVLGRDALPFMRIYDQVMVRTLIRVNNYA